ncbi:MAG: response regulator transcription factor [Clostridia bacterium]|jgi:two-component system OmpR family response regulator|nr:response regulator transcription factor [Clostridia bacterium]
MNKVMFKNILIVEDGDKLRNSLTEYFSAMNKVTACPTLKSAISACAENEYDITLLDLILPDGNGIELLRYLRRTPVIILSDLGTDENVIDGLSAGAADYIVKPCSPQVIEAKMSLRLLPNGKANLSSGGLTLNVQSRTAVYKNTVLDFTSSEFNILTFLMQNAGVYFNSNEIYEQVWKMPHLNTETIKKHLSNLRKKLLAVSDECAALLTTKFGKGYAFIGGKND